MTTPKTDSMASAHNKALLAAAYNFQVNTLGTNLSGYDALRYAIEVYLTTLLDSPEVQEAVGLAIAENIHALEGEDFDAVCDETVDAALSTIKTQAGIE